MYKKNNVIAAKIGILTSKRSWFLPYAKGFVGALRARGFQAKLFLSQEEIKENLDFIFILSYFKVINKAILNKISHKLVVHESDLPHGRGWAPLFWQILENKNKIPVVLFEATDKVDSGDIYLKDHILLNGDELNDEIRKRQADKTIKLCWEFLRRYNDLKPLKQSGRATYYRRRTSEDSGLDINKSIKKQFNLLRTVDNEKFPAFFYYKGRKYLLKIFKTKSSHGYKNRK